MEDSPVWTLGPLRLDPDRADARGVLWFLYEEQGFFGAPETTGSTDQRLGAHGGIRSPGWKTERSISLSGYAFAPSYRELRRAVHQVSAVASNPNAPIPLTCYSELGPLVCSVWLDGEIITKPLDIQRPGIEFSLQLTAPDPRKYATRSRTWRAGLPQINTGDGLDFRGAAPSPFGAFSTFSALSTSLGNVGHGLDFADDGGLRFGTSNSTGIMQLVNDGTAPTSPVYTLHGPLDSPVLTATTGGVRSTMRYGGSLTAGESLVIDPEAPSVLLGGVDTASRRHLLNPSQFSGFAVPGGDVATAGTLSVGLTHDGPSTAEGYVSATVTDAWW